MQPGKFARWIAEARSNPKIKWREAPSGRIGNYDVLSPDVFRLMDDAVGPSGLPVISHTGNDRPNVRSTLLDALHVFRISFIAAHLGIGVLGPGDTAI